MTVASYGYKRRARGEGLDPVLTAVSTSCTGRPRTSWTLRIDGCGARTPAAKKEAMAMMDGFPNQSRWPSRRSRPLRSSWTQWGSERWPVAMVTMVARPWTRTGSELWGGRAQTEGKERGGGSR